jgi:zinc resistance-associated protein
LEIVMTWMTVLAGTTALVLVGSTLAVPAQDQRGGPQQGQFADPSQDDGTARVNTDLAWLKEMLRLTPEQERNWPAFETALRDLIKLRLDRAADLRDRPLPGTPVERLRRSAEELAGIAAAFTRLAAAAEPLYVNLDDGQKRRFARLSRIAREHVAMLGERMRDSWESMRGGRGFDERDGRDGYRDERDGSTGYRDERDGSTGYRYGDDEARQRQSDTIMPREMMRMYREMMRMHRDMMRSRGQYEGHGGWRDRDADRWSDRDEGRRSYGRGMDEGRRPYGRGMTEGWGGRDRYDDNER